MLSSSTPGESTRVDGEKGKGTGFPIKAADKVFIGIRVTFEAPILTTSFVTASSFRTVRWPDDWCSICNRDAPEVLIVDGICTSIARKHVRPDSKDRGWPWDHFVSCADKGLDLTAARRKVSVRGARLAKSGTCRKRFSEEKKSTSGGQLLTHCPHGFLFGFSKLGFSENVSAVLDLLTNYTMEAPRLVLYDFGCGLAAAAKHRHAAYFQHTKFAVDEFHRRNHVCNYEYSLSKYLDECEDALARAIPTSQAESTNSTVRNIGSSIAYARQSLAWCIMRAFMSAFNCLRAVRAKEELEKITRFGFAGPLDPTTFVLEWDDAEKDSCTSGSANDEDDSKESESSYDEESQHEC